MHYDMGKCENQQETILHTIPLWLLHEATTVVKSFKNAPVTISQRPVETFFDW